MVGGDQVAESHMAKTAQNQDVSWFASRLG